MGLKELLDHLTAQLIMLQCKMKWNVGRSLKGFVYRIIPKNVNCGLNGLILPKFLQKIMEIETSQVVIMMKVTVFYLTKTLLSRELTMKKLIDQFAKLSLLV